MDAGGAEIQISFCVRLQEGLGALRRDEIRRPEPSRAGTSPVQMPPQQHLSCPGPLCVPPPTHTHTQRLYLRRSVKLEERPSTAHDNHGPQPLLASLCCLFYPLSPGQLFTPSSLPPSFSPQLMIWLLVLWENRTAKAELAHVPASAPTPITADGALLCSSGCVLPPPISGTPSLLH